MPRWRANVEGAALRGLFQSGQADPHNTASTTHMNEVYNNNQMAFQNVTQQNFHANYRRVAAEWIAEQGMQGARHDTATGSNRTCGGTGTGTAQPDAGEFFQ